MEVSTIREYFLVAGVARRLVYCCALDGTYTKTFVGRVSTRHVGLKPDLQYRSGGSHKFQIACNTTLVTFLASPRKVTKRRRTPIRHLIEVPCVARLVRRLRNLHCVLRQSWLRHNLKVSLHRNKSFRAVLSPPSPDRPPLLGGGRGEGKAKIKSKFKSEVRVWALPTRFIFCF